MRKFSTEAEALNFVMEEIPWGNAAGVTKNGKLLVRFAEAGMRDVVFGSITKEARAGNAGDNFYYDERTGSSINSWGIPNAGIDSYLPELPAIKKEVNKHGARLWVSISAGDSFKPKEYQDMAFLLARSDAADVIEGNLSYPNMIVSGKPKPNVCYDLQAFLTGVQALRVGSLPGTKDEKKVAVKLAPITEPVILRGLVEACIQNGVDYIVAANTIGNCYIQKPDGSPGITMVRGGLAGKGLRPLVKGMIQMIVPMLKGTRTKLIDAGGVDEGGDAHEYLELGAHGFQFNTALTCRNYDPSFIHDLVNGYDGNPLYHGPGLIGCLLNQGLPD